MEIDVLNNYDVNYEKLLKYGFKKEGKNYTYKVSLDNDLYAIFSLDIKLYISVYDQDGLEYIPFKVKNNNGTYASFIKDKIENIKNDIIEKCFIKNNFKDKILSYVYKKYKTKEEYPWEDSPDYYTLKVNGKWYLLYMNIKYELIDKEKKGMVDVINLKLDPNMIEQLIDNKTYFPAYHMNKKYWITVLLDNNIDFEIVCSLIDQSFEIVAKK